MDLSVLKRGVLFLFGIELLFVALNIWPTPSEATNRAFNLDHESNIIVWFASAQLLVLSLFSFLLHSKLHTRGWLALSLGFLFLSIDETAALHESFGASLYNQYISPNYENGGWLIFFAAPLLVGAILIARAWWKLKEHSRSIFYWGNSGLLCWIAVLVLEAQGSRFDAAIILEEFLELFGATLMIYATGCALLNTGRTSSAPALQS